MLRPAAPATALQRLQPRSPAGLENADRGLASGAAGGNVRVRNRRPAHTHETHAMNRPDRRQFVRGAAALLGAPLLASSSALGDDKKPAASERIGLGFIGMGTMNRGHLNHF